MAVPLLATARRVLQSRAFRLLLVRVGPVVAAQAMSLARHGQWRQLAILHADSLTDGQFSREVLDDGAIHWIVWHGDEAVASYPPFEGPLDRAVEGHDPANRRAPRELPSRRVRQASGDRARAAGQRVGRLVRRDRGQ